MVRAWLMTLRHNVTSVVGGCPPSQGGRRFARPPKMAAADGRCARYDTHPAPLRPVSRSKRETKN